MANGIGRKRLMGISLETTFGSTATDATPTYVLPLLDTPRFTYTVNKEENNSAHGSRYEVNAVDNANRMGGVSLNVKIDENHLPIFLKQNFNITTNNVAGDTNAKEHTATYANSPTVSYALFIQDGDRTSKFMAGTKFTSMNLFAEQGYFRVELEGVGKYPVDWSGVATDSQPNAFVGRNATISMVTSGGALASIPVLRATFNHVQNQSGDDFNFVLGNQDMTTQVSTTDRFETEITLRHSDFTYHDYYRDNTELNYKLSVTDTGRIISTATSTNPLVEVEYATGHTLSWADEGGLDDPLSETYTLLATDKVGEVNAPSKWIIRNNVASY